MCGIAGFFAAGSTLDRPDATRRVARMLALLAHRGPDGSGTLVEGPVALGNVRLSIVDLAGGSQPVSTADGRYHIVYNGEVFNHEELRTSLEGEGVQFRTRSDTEVVLQLFVKHRRECLPLLNGQFAFAIYDADEGRLFLARDRVGIRPLFLRRTGGELQFSSEVKGFFADPSFAADLDPLGVSQLLTYWVPISPRTVFRGVEELPPATWMEIDRAGGETVGRYWSYSAEEEGGDPTRSLDSLLEEFDPLFRDAVRCNLRGDVPAAAYLSGGLDSTLTTALIANDHQGRLATFSLTFEDPRYDEGEYQRVARSVLRTEHRELRIGNRDLADALTEVLYHTETPLLRTSPVPMQLLAGIVRREGFKVVVTGEGADEVFGGYNIFRETVARCFWAKNPRSKYRPLALRRLYPYLRYNGPSFAATLAPFFGYRLEETGEPFYSHLIRWKNTGRLRQFLSEEFVRDFDPAASLGGIEALMPEGFRRQGNVARAQSLEFSLFMSTYLLAAQGDRPAMANGVEGRYPFLDHRVIEFGAKIPPRYRVRGLTEKYFLRRYADRVLPPQLSRRPKQPYRAPIGGLFASPEFRRFDDLLHAESRYLGKVARERLLKKVRTEPEKLSEVDEMACVAMVSILFLEHRFKQEAASRLAGGVHP